MNLWHRFGLMCVPFVVPLVISFLPEPSFATESHHVRSYVTKRGTYVAAHRQTKPDHTKLNNWSTKGNVNPYTGKPGTKIPHN